MVKQVICMRKDLNMRKGKMISQGAHASLKVFLDRAVLRSNTLSISDINEDIMAWLMGSFTKICLSVDSELELDAVYQQAKAQGLPVALIVDAGHTEFGGVPTKTCLAIGPALSSDIDKITGHLKLL